MKTTKTKLGIQDPTVSTEALIPRWCGGARSSRRICLMIESTPPEGYEGNPRSQPTTLSGNGEVVQPDKTEANYCNATTSNKYSPNHTLSFQSTQPRTKLEARTGRRLNGCCCKSQSEFTLSQGKFTRAKEEVNSQTIFWLHLANLCWKQIAKEF